MHVKQGKRVQNVNAFYLVSDPYCTVLCKSNGGMALEVESTLLMVIRMFCIMCSKKLSVVIE